MRTKAFFILLAIFGTIGCNSSKEKQKSDLSTENIQNPSMEQSEKINETVSHENSVMLLGKADRSGLERDEFQEWFDPGYENYIPDHAVMKELQPLMENLEITLFMGTWCEDSHRDVPHLYKVLDNLDFDESKMEVYAVSEEKTTPQGYEIERNVHHVPTIIFYKNGEELGRIVEYSIRTLEQDMFDILSGKDYKHPYSE